MLFRWSLLSAAVLALLPIATDVPAAQVPQAAGGTCLDVGAGDMDQLLAQVRRVVTREIPRSDEIRASRGLTKGAAGSVVPILDETVCATALVILKEHLGDLATVSDQVAVVKVQGRYVARYRFRYPAQYVEVVKPQTPNVRTFYFDREFTRVTVST